MKKLFLTTLILSASIHMMAQVDPVNKDGVAIGGYDVVGYFESGRPIKGDIQITSIHNGTSYYFSSLQNKKQFEADPLKYVPQYEGYCALAVS